MCGHKGASLRVKQQDPDRDDYAPFPIEPEWTGGSRKEIVAAGGWYVLSARKSQAGVAPVESR
jgi:hypothetical protein